MGVRTIFNPAGLEVDSSVAAGVSNAGSSRQTIRRVLVASVAPGVYTENGL